MRSVLVEIWKISSMSALFSKIHFKMFWRTNTFDTKLAGIPVREAVLKVILYGWKKIQITVYKLLKIEFWKLHPAKSRFKGVAGRFDKIFFFSGQKFRPALFGFWTHAKWLSFLNLISLSIMAFIFSKKYILI